MMDGQMTLFDFMPKQLSPGEIVETHGRELTFQEAYGRVGEMLILDVSTQNHEWFKAVFIEESKDIPDIYNDCGNLLQHGYRRIIAFDGARQRCLLSDYFFTSEGYKGPSPIRLYEI